MEELRKNLLTSRLPPTSALRSAGDMTSKYSKKSINMKKQHDFKPTQWTKYFERSETVEVNNKKDKFRVYRSGDEGPILLLLHGGGYSALTWAIFSAEVRSRVVCQTVAIDLRGHGDTVTENDYDLSAETLSADVGNVVNAIFGDEPPPIVVIGHSMGGAIAVHTASRGHIRTLAGVCVIDVVEGTAMQALASMQSYLRGRPKNFRSLEHAIEWAFRSGHTRNLEAAKVSMPGQLKNLYTGVVATNELTENLIPPESTTETDSLRIHSTDSILEEEEEEEELGKQKSDNHFKPPGPSSNNTAAPASSYTWRIDLSKTEMYWPGWFQGLSDLFLNHIQSSKLLLLASINGLDTDLTVGQMQGKFQMQVLTRCGHAVQEDTPDQVADVLASFLLRNRLTTSCGDFVRTFPAC